MIGTQISRLTRYQKKPPLQTRRRSFPRPSNGIFGDGSYTTVFSDGALGRHLFLPAHRSEIHGYFSTEFTVSEIPTVARKENILKRISEAFTVKMHQRYSHRAKEVWKEESGKRVGGG